MTFYYGCHMTSTKFMKSMETITDLGGNFMQVFVSNPRGFSKGDVVAKYSVMAPDIKKYCKENKFKLVIHAPYSFNYAKQINYDDYQFTQIKKELQVAHMIGAIGCVIHVGKSLNLNIHKATANMLCSLKHIAKYIKDNNLKSKLILETSSGQGTEMLVTTNNSLIPLSTFYNMFTDVEKQSIKLCIDTCHIFVAGMDIRTKNGANNLFKQLKSFDIQQHVALIHFNDSAKNYETRVDRHEAIGQGFIGFTGLRQVLKLAYKLKIPCVLETPNDAYEEEIPWITKMINKTS